MCVSQRPRAMLRFQPQMKDTPLIRAAHNGHLHVVQYLLEQGADLATMDLVSTSPRKQPPTLTPRCQHSSQCLRGHLPSPTCFVSAAAQGDNTALHWAAMRGHVEIVNVLISAGADKTIRNKQDKLPVRGTTACRTRRLDASCAFCKSCMNSAGVPCDERPAGPMAATGAAAVLRRLERAMRHLKRCSRKEAALSTLAELLLRALI